MRVMQAAIYIRAPHLRDDLIITKVSEATIHLSEAR
jgi:hypothetical protein